MKLLDNWGSVDSKSILGRKLQDDVPGSSGNTDDG